VVNLGQRHSQNPASSARVPEPGPSSCRPPTGFLMRVPSCWAPFPPSLFRREGKPSIKGHHTRLLARVHAQSSPPRAPPCRLCCPSPSSPLHSLPEPSDHLGLLPRVHSSFHPHSLPSLASGFAKFRVATAAPPLPDHRPSSPEPPCSLLPPQRGH
jgi:hypothetical protein